IYTRSLHDALPISEQFKKISWQPILPIFSFPSFAFMMVATSMVKSYNVRIMKTIEDRLRKIEKLLLGKKEALTFDEVCSYTGISPSYMYKLTSARKVPHYKP